MKPINPGVGLSARSLLHLTTGVVAALFLVACGGSDSKEEETPDVYTVSTEVNIGGTWSPAERSVEHGDTAAFTLTWDATAFRLLNTQGCGGSFSEGTYTTGAITSACTVSAEFEANQAPTVNAGEDMTVTSDDTVTLQGDASDDVAIASWLWEQTAGPSVTLANADTATATFVAPDVDENTNLEFQLTVTDSDGATASDTVVVTVEPKILEVTGVALVASDQRTVGDTLSVYLDSDDDFESATWSVSNRSTAQDVSFTRVNGNTIEFTIDASAYYDVTVTSESGLSEQTLAILTTNIPEPDPAALEDYDGTTPVDEVVSVVTNQSWVVSRVLTEAELRDLVVNTYSELQPGVYDSTQGLLLEYNADSLLAREQLEMLRLQPSVASVHQRVHTGVNSDISFVITLPDDGDTWGDGGSNWQLEAEGANFVEAWETTTGNSNIRVAIIDSGFYANHEEIAGRFSHVLTNGQSGHGNATAGAIVGASDNGVGVTGMNHTSQAVLSRWGIHSYVETLGQNDSSEEHAIKVVNNSWGPMGNSSASVNAGILFSRAYRLIALYNSDVLHVWAAGNDGTSATYQNGALHLNDTGSYSPLDNILVVAAHGADGVLLPYSNYGTTVDIAAPSEYLGVGAVVDGQSQYYVSDNDTYGNCYSGGFNGTSAAAPVVSGVASLIYSMYPGFSAAEVRNILIESADTFITQRHATSDSCTGGAPELVDLPNPIPVLNAANAVSMAQDIINGRVTVQHTVSNPFMPSSDFMVSSIDSNLELQTIAWTLESFVNGESWQVVDSGSGVFDMGMFSGSFDPQSNQHRITLDVELLDQTSETLVTASRTYPFAVGQVTFVARDTVSLAPIAGADLTIAFESGLVSDTTGLTDEQGMQHAWFTPGSYTVFAQATDYQDNAVNFVASADDVQQVFVNMTSSDAGAVGSISGVVVDQNDVPIAGASVRISGGELTNGYFASAVTDSNGEYVISNISKTAANGQPIVSFTMEASAPMHATIVREEVIVLAGLDRTENFRLNEVVYTEEELFVDNFEAGAGDWEATGMWHIEAMPGNTLYNLLVEQGFVLFAPDEVSDFAYLPQAYQGDHVWWYGAADTGTFIGTQNPNDSPLSGGRSTTSNQGTLTSPVIDLTTATNPHLDLQTWWEIESVNPNSSGFDLMRIQISQNGGSFVTVRTLNPYVDPNDSERAAKPFSSAGYNRMPVWANETLDLSEYAGSEIQVRFMFNTVDSLYNGFRGWVLDNFRLVDISYDEVEPSIASGRVKARMSDAFKKQHRLPKAQPEVLQHAPEREQGGSLQ
ncbi:peptidase [Aliidiomarina taiwanensis]|uniref:Peptidase n=1 Tax=Aliidiomarina taiwanensis TaxID=946228 RepID=A0A432X9N3_9GAMM|nr:S8 family serine peptidase [Aliidiomarina taiwanensis]RUO44135.1 peptidase [Aliidiomarina taiwanensis]